MFSLFFVFLRARSLLIAVAKGEKFNPKGETTLGVTTTGEVYSTQMDTHFTQWLDRIFGSFCLYPLLSSVSMVTRMQFKFIIVAMVGEYFEHNLSVFGD